VCGGCSRFAAHVFFWGYFAQESDEFCPREGLKNSQTLDCNQLEFAIVAAAAAAVCGARIEFRKLFRFRQAITLSWWSALYSSTSIADVTACFHTIPCVLYSPVGCH
jgi:hypothetical protein